MSGKEDSGNGSIGEDKNALRFRREAELNAALEAEGLSRPKDSKLCSTFVKIGLSGEWNAQVCILRYVIE
jgi:hypothetical protein